MAKLAVEGKLQISAVDFVHNTNELIAALNNPKSKNKAVLRHIFEEYNSLKVLKDLSADDLLEYSTLARIKPDDKDTQKSLEKYVEVWQEYVGVWQKKIAKGFASPKFRKCVEQFLRFIDVRAFKNDSTLLAELGQSLLDTLPTDVDQYTANTYPTHKNTLNALHQTLIKIRAISGDRWNPRERNGLCVQFKRQLDRIAKSKYYPLRYQVEWLQQSLVRLKTTPNKWEKATNAAGQVYKGAKGLVQVIQGAMGATLLNVDVDEIEAGVYSIANAAATDQGELDAKVSLGKCAELVGKSAYRTKPWYKQLLGMGTIEALCLADEANALTYLDEYEEKLAILLRQEQERPLPKAQRRVLHYGLARQLALMAWKGNVSTSKQCIAQMAALLDNAHWRKDDAVVRELLTSLEIVKTVRREEAVTKEAASVLGKAEEQPDEAIPVPDRGWVARMACGTPEYPLWQMAEAWRRRASLPGHIRSAKEFQERDAKLTQGHHRLYNEVAKQIKEAVKDEWEKAQTAAAHEWQRRQKRAAHERIARQSKKNLQTHYREYFSTIRSFDNTLKLPIESVYVNLSVIKAQELTIEVDNKSSSQRNQFLQAYKNPYTKETIALDKIFSPRKEKDEKIASEIHTVLLTGRAGVGKTTLCQKVAHLWAQGAWYSDKFEA
ncbi:MAG: NACHT domain-containing protein, partial [Bacteroidota bacterium]